MNPNDLTFFEQLVVRAYSEGDSRLQAAEAISKFGELDFWKQNLFVLKQSKNPYALHFAATNLRNVLTNYVNSFASNDKAELRATMLSVLADLGDQFWGNTTVRPVLVECFCRLQKLCWFDSAGPSTALLSEVMPFLQHSLAHSIIGINLLQQLVMEMSNSIPTITYAVQRKIAVVFREKCLQEIFTLGLKSIQRILQAPQAKSETEMAQQNMLKKESLELINQVLNFDFIGTSPDATSDDVGIIHVPETWSVIFEDKDTLGVLFGVYEKYGPPYSTKAMEVLVQIAGVRNSVFHNDEARIAFMNLLVDGLGSILTTNKDLDHPENTHQLARLLTRLKSNYQLKHLLEAANYTAFIQKVAEFSVTVFKKSTSFNSVFYIFSFWSRMVAANTLIKIDQSLPTRLSELVPVIFREFVAAQIDHVAHPISPEDTLDSEHLRTVLEELPGVVRCTCAEVANFLLNGLRSIAQTAQPHMAQAPTPQLLVAEKQLAWMIFICSSVIGCRNGGARPVPEEDGDWMVLEAQVVVTLFECLSMHDIRLQKQQAKTPGTRHLELAFIYFLQKFCKLYLTDTSGGTQSKVYELLAQRVELATSGHVIERIVQKVIMLLKLWPDADIIEQTLGSSGLFWALATGFSSSKLMGKSSMVTNLLEHHFELDIGNASTRRAFYKTLGRLLFGVNSTTNFYVFIRPFQQRLEQVKSTLGVASGEQRQGARVALVQVLNDLRGICESIYTKDKGYSQFFEWFYHDIGCYEWLAQLLSQAQQYQLDVEECWAVLNFADEFCNNQHRRIAFPVNSADGIRLFRTTSHLLIQFAKYMMSGQHPNDIDFKFKSFKLFFRCLHRSLTGGYTNFGVFEMYNDQILNDLLKVSSSVLFSLDMSQLEVHSKVFTLVFNVLETIATNHTAFLVALDQNAFHQLLLLCQRGLNCTLKPIISDSCVMLDKLFSLHVNNVLMAQQNRINPRGSAPQQLEWMNSHISKDQPLINSIIMQLINLIITTDGVHWFASKPLLPLIFISQKEFSFIQQLIVNSQAQDEQRASKVVQQFNGLMSDIKMNLESENREKFNSNATAFRAEVKQLLDLNMFYKAIIQYTKE